MKVIYKLIAASFSAFAAFFTSISALAQPADLLGQWDFDAGSLAATAGLDMDFNGDTQSRTTFGTTASLGIPAINGTSANVMLFPTNEVGQGYTVSFFTAANGGGVLLNQWTIIFDLLYPTASANQFRALMETDGRTIAPDADFLINATGGIGGNASFDGQIAANTWYRVGFVVNASSNVINKYINGVLVGSMPATSGATAALDGRWALNTFTGVAELFNDDNGQTAPGYVNSIQLRSAALTTPQMRAMGGPSASGIPQVIPPIPSFIENWIPSGALALANTDVGAVIFKGDSVISAVELRLDGTLQASPSIVDSGELITVRKTPAAPLAIASKHTVQLTYQDSQAGTVVVSNQFEIAVFLENFNGLTLGPKVDEGLAGDTVWTKSPPAGWAIDDSGVPGVGDPGMDGVTEWAGWSFADRDWWATTAGGQRREEFIKANGAVAIFDPDEWDDQSHAAGMLNSWLATPDISLAGVAPNTVVMKLDTSWRDECCDDTALTNDQTFIIYVQYNGGASNVVMHWSSNPADPNFHDDEPNGTQIIPLNNPAGATTMKLSFGGLYSENDWWLAFDNLQIVASTLPPTITTQPQSDSVSAGANVTLSVLASSQAPLSYQWFFNSTNLAGATSSNLLLANVQLANAGDYRVIVSNSAGSVTSQVARIEVFSGSITQDLVIHLKFDGDFIDSSGRGNNAAGGVTGTPTFVPGRVGTQAMHIQTNDVDAGFQPFATLGAPADLNFGTSTDFSVSFWTRIVRWNSDPSLIGNKDWDSGSNPGWVIFTSDGQLGLNLAGPPGGRKDAGVATGGFGTGGNGDNVWHHCVISFDRSGPASFYLDGVKRGTMDLGASQNNLDTPAGFATNIGQDGAGDYGPKFQHADFDDVGMWRRVLTPQEVASIYGQGLLGQDLSTATGVPPALPPTITTQPSSRLVSVGGSATFSVVATGDGTLGYQWQKDSANVGGGTASSLTLNAVQAANAGSYRVIVSNAGGSVTSAPVVLQVFAGTASQDLVAWLRFEGNYSDSSGHGNHGTPVGSPSLVPGKVGQGLFFKTTADGSVINYVTLGYPPDLQFGTGDFSVAFWISYTNQVDDPAFIASQNWDSSNNTGWGLYSQGGANFRVVVTGNPSSRMNITATPAVRNTGWRHILMSCWRNQVGSIYVDGALVNTTPLTIAGSVDTFSLGYSVNIGQDGRGTYTDGGGAAIEGYIDEVQLFRRALTAQDAAAIYAKGTNGQSAFPNIVSVVQSGGGTTATLTVDGGTAPYTVQRKNSLSDTDWTDVVTTNSTTIVIPATGASGFLRVVSRITFNVTLNGANERPNPVSPAGTGSGTVTLDGNTVTVNVAYSGMTSAVNNSHIHGPATTEQAAGVLLNLTNTGGTSGTVTGSATLSALNVQRVLSGLTYVNIHTANNTGGEIRGQILGAP